MSALVRKLTGPVDFLIEVVAMLIATMITMTYSAAVILSPFAVLHAGLTMQAPEYLRPLIGLSTIPLTILAPVVLLKAKDIFIELLQ